MHIGGAAFVNIGPGPRSTCVRSALPRTGTTKGACGYDLARSIRSRAAISLVLARDGWRAATWVISSGAVGPLPSATDSGPGHRSHHPTPPLLVHEHARRRFHLY